MEKLFIRVDGNPVLGLGHMMRCYAIASALRKIGVDCCFLVADKDSVSAMAGRNFGVWELGSTWNDLDKETDLLVELIQREKIKLLLIDSYYVSEEYLKTLRRYTKVAYLTGMNHFIYPVDILINYHIYAEKLGYNQQYNNKTKLLLGCDYVPLREEFLSLEPYNPDRKAVLITTGGTDPYGIVPKLLVLLQENNLMDLDYHIVIGKYYDGNEVEQIKKWKRFPNIFLYEDVKSMAELMKNCSIAVSAAGSTLYELCACGIPTVTFAFADNQKLPAEAFLHQGLMECAGDIRECIEDGIKQIVQGIKTYAFDRKLRIKRSCMVRERIDGKGAEHLAEQLKREIEEPKYL